MSDSCPRRSGATRWRSDRACLGPSGDVGPAPRRRLEEDGSPNGRWPVGPRGGPVPDGAPAHRPRSRPDDSADGAPAPARARASHLGPASVVSCTARAYRPTDGREAGVGWHRASLSRGVGSRDRAVLRPPEGGRPDRTKGECRAGTSTPRSAHAVAAAAAPSNHHETTCPTPEPTVAVHHPRGPEARRRPRPRSLRRRSTARGRRDRARVPRPVGGVAWGSSRGGTSSGARVATAWRSRRSHRRTLAVPQVVQVCRGVVVAGRPEVWWLVPAPTRDRSERADSAHGLDPASGDCATSRRSRSSTPEAVVGLAGLLTVIGLPQAGDHTRRIGRVRSAGSAPRRGDADVTGKSGDRDADASRRRSGRGVPAGERTRRSVGRPHRGRRRGRSCSGRSSRVDRSDEGVAVRGVDEREEQPSDGGTVPACRTRRDSVGDDTVASAASRP